MTKPVIDPPSKSRSYNMSQIRGKDTKPEEIVRKFLFSKGFRYRKNVTALPGKPDIVLSKYHTVIFVNGCFWHGHSNCRYFVVPRTNTEFWLNKIETNRQRDARKITELQNLGWRVIVLWECQLKQNVVDEPLQSLAKEIRLVKEDEEDGEKMM